MGGCVALHRLWRAESKPTPRSIAEALGPSAITSGVSLDDIRSGRLIQVLASISEAGSVAICDVETESDLELIVAAAQEVRGFSIGRNLGARDGSGTTKNRAVTRRVPISS